MGSSTAFLAALAAGVSVVLLLVTLFWRFLLVGKLLLVVLEHFLLVAFAFTAILELELMKMMKMKPSVGVVIGNGNLLYWYQVLQY